jgi:hypothetical protein
LNPVASAALERLWAEVASERPGDGLCRARRVSTEGAVHIFAGIRNADGARALLVELDNKASPSLRFRFETEGLSLYRQPSGQARTLFALVATDPLVNPLFGTLAADVASHVVTGSDGEAGRRLESRLSVWRNALRPRRELMSRAEVLGLWGELQALMSLADALTPELAVAMWVGPESGIHDFVGNGIGVECKAQVGADPALRVSSLEQLDPSGLRRLGVRRLRLTEAPNGRSLADLVVEVRARIGGWDLERKLALAGWRDADSGAHAEPRLVVVDETLFDVRAGFPSLIRSSVPVGILDATYRIDPQLLDEFKLAPSDAQQLILELGGADGKGD